MRSANYFAGANIDRAAKFRKNAAWLQARMADPSSRVLPVWRDSNLVTTGDAPRAVLLDLNEARRLAGNGADLAFLGLVGDAARFTVDISHLDHPLSRPELSGRGKFVELRAVGALLEQREGALLAFARGLVHWHSRNGFCSLCGGPTVMREAGHVRICENRGCGAQHFPRTDPAVIMLVTSGEACLLGRKKGWNNLMYSTLAGFVEPGESLEEAVAREVMEEAGIHVVRVRYHSSQPWPFPASLMLGFTAEAVSPEIHLNREELADARWFGRDELKTPGKRAAAGLRLPRRVSVARRLIEDWLAEG